MEPLNIKCWEIGVEPSSGLTFVTCARPGRSFGPDNNVPDDVVSSWVRGLPGPNTVIVSLLGRKRSQNKLSEFSYYSFYGKWDSPSERNNKPSFQEWLDQYHKDLQILVREHPTYDDTDIPSATICAIATDVHRFVEEGRTVVAMDSFGVGRTRDVAKYLKATEVGWTDQEC